MNLREIGLSAPRPVSREDALAEDMSRVVCSLLVLGLKRRIMIDDVWKISIHINHPNEEIEGKNLLGVLVVNRTFPTAEFIKWDLSVRQNHMLDFICGVLKDICRATHLGETVVDDARSFVLENQFRRTIVGKKRFKGPNQFASARIECDWEMDEARIYVAASLSKRERRRVEVAKSRPDEFLLQGYFGKLEWIGPASIVLHKINGDLLPVVLAPGNLPSKSP